MQVVETFVCDCEGKHLHCRRCRGTGVIPYAPEKAWLWADGKWRDEMPPSEEELVAEYSDLTEEPASKRAKRENPYPPVTGDYRETIKTGLRERALDFAIRAATFMQVRMSGSELLKEAEIIERWIAQAEKLDE